MIEIVDLTQRRSLGEAYKVDWGKIIKISLVVGLAVWVLSGITYQPKKA